MPKVIDRTPAPSRRPGLVVLTADQQDSRHGPDLVPATLGLLTPVATLRPFERTAGDELQGVLDDPAALTLALELLLRAGEWNLGVGVGEANMPLPASTRAGSGAVFLHAREAVTAAKGSPWRLRVVDGTEAGPARALETTLWLWAAVLARRTSRGWEVADLVEDQHLSYEEAGRRLGISQSAVSQRARAAGLVEGRRARELVTYLASQLMHPRE